LLLVFEEKLLSRDFVASLLALAVTASNPSPKPHRFYEVSAFP
jgi:hypothetical protein